MRHQRQWRQLTTSCRCITHLVVPVGPVRIVDGEASQVRGEGQHLTQGGLVSEWYAVQLHGMSKSKQRREEQA